MFRTVLFAIVALVASAPVLAQDAEQTAILEQRAEDIVSAMQGAADYEGVFASVFVEALPEAQFIGFGQQITSQFGPLIGLELVEPVQPDGARIAIRFERGLASGSFTVESAEPSKVNSFVLNDIRPVGDTTEQLLEDAAALPGEVSVLITQLGERAPSAVLNADRPMAIGSTFKLYVLSALTRSIAAGERDWADVVQLGVRSFPSGQLQDWPQGAPITLQTLATLMIASSDNTATDQLMALLGREAIEAEVLISGHAEPAVTMPMLTTREMFLLKSGSEVDTAEYLAADEPARREALQRLIGVQRDAAAVQSAFTRGPNTIEIEWLASVEDIARLFQTIISLGDETALQIMGVNPALPSALRAEWAYVGYKGGSEPGVLNVSWLLRDTERNWHAVSLSWNNPHATVDHATMNMLAMRAISLAGGD